MLDLAIRDATSARRSLDDLMRAMLAQSQRGFTGKDVEHAASSVCGCDIGALFDSSVRGAAQIDFDRSLRLAGLRMQVGRRKTFPDGRPVDDAWVYAWMVPGEPAPKLQLMTADSAWGRAGVHTGDSLLKFNGSPVTSADDFMKTLEAMHIGDTFRVEVRQNGALRQAAVTIGSTDLAVVKIQELPDPTEPQRNTFAKWARGE
jgi:predicted metalloprotease with PDZ domain